MAHVGDLLRRVGRYRHRRLRASSVAAPAGEDGGASQYRHRTDRGFRWDSPGIAREVERGADDTAQLGLEEDSRPDSRAAVVPDVGGTWLGEDGGAGALPHRVAAVAARSEGQ